MPDVDDEPGSCLTGRRFAAFKVVTISRAHTSVTFRRIRRALGEWYGLPATLPISKSAALARARFGRDAVYVNQYLFHRQRLAARVRRCNVVPELSRR